MIDITSLLEVVEGVAGSLHDRMVQAGFEFSYDGPDFGAKGGSVN